VLHHPLLVHDGGAKLSKASGDTALRERRAAGVRADALIGEAAFLVGLAPSPAPLNARDVGALFLP
jgi:glutamyl/glutaminyl-tRNA synthetase